MGYVRVTGDGGGVVDDGVAEGLTGIFDVSKKKKKKEQNKKLTKKKKILCPTSAQATK